MFMLGLIMFIAACVMTYLYFDKVKGKSGLSERNALAAKKAAELRAEQKPQALEIQNAGPGAVIKLEGVGLESQSFDLQITARHLIKEGQDRSIELEGTNGAATIYLSIEDDGVFATLKTVELSDLGIKSDALQKMKVSSGASVQFEGDTYELTDVGVAKFCEGGNELEAETVQHWDFACKGSDQFLSVERWSDGSVEVSYSVPVKSGQITVYSLQ